MTALPEARIIVTVPLARGGGSRVVAIDEREVCHVCTVDDRREGQAADQSFTAEIAQEMARRVLAGDERAQTAPGMLRILAAAVLMLHQETLEFAEEIMELREQESDLLDGMPTEGVTG
ncbi:hypothetical protein [Jiella pacifica]|uniref:Uncharacterized protein n=1 Tax=Jiella pacifica TaxID=2696469 RepID=A0A6N9T520_9HYPH|nr:hypothetical protein [Jiella pacifica]NDW04048.1 hypothetical protein [Jiella pacifica]